MPFRPLLRRLVRRHGPCAALAAALVAGLSVVVLGAAAPARAAVPFITQNAERAAAYAASRGETAAVGVLDTVTGAAYYAGDDTRLMPTESVVKTMIATRLLLTGQMSGSVADTAWKMITQSDDGSANALYGRVGGDSLINWIEAHYRISIGTPPSRPGWWGNTHVTARGLVTFYHRVRHDARVAPWLLNAMHHATKYGSDGTYQYYGIPSSTTGWAIKQGWGADDDCFCHTAFNSTGFVTGDRYAVAMLTTGGSYGTHAMDTLTGMARMLIPLGHVEESWHQPVLALARSTHGSDVVFSGYAFDRDAPSVSLRIDILVNGELVQRLWTMRSLPSVNSTYGLTGDHGFGIAFPMRDGGYEFEIRVYNRWYGSDTVAYRWLLVNGDPIGTLQGTTVSGSTVSLVGYGFDPDATSTSNDVQIRQDGAVVTTVPADVYSAPVNSAHGITGNHGFQVVLPDVSTGTHSWCAYGVNLGSALARPYGAYGCSTATVP